MNATIDTNVLLRFLLKDVPKQAEVARKKFQEAKQTKTQLSVSQIVIFEVVFALTRVYKFDKSDIVEAIKSLLGAEFLKIQDREVFGPALSLFTKRNISLADCFIVAFSKFNKAPLFTFDKDLAKLE